jgi:hypothetical protein
MDAQVPLCYCKRERGSRFPHTPTRIPSPTGATNQRSATQNMNCLQHVIFIYILVSFNWYQFRTGHSWSTRDGLNQTSCGTAGKLTHYMIRRRISERIVTPYPAISRHLSVSIHTHLQLPPPLLNFLRPTLLPIDDKNMKKQQKLYPNLIITSINSTLLIITQHSHVLN